MAIPKGKAPNPTPVVQNQQEEIPADGGVLPQQQQQQQQQQQSRGQRQAKTCVLCNGTGHLREECFGHFAKFIGFVPRVTTVCGIYGGNNHNGDHHPHNRDVSKDIEFRELQKKEAAERRAQGHQQSQASS